MFISGLYLIKDTFGGKYENANCSNKTRTCQIANQNGDVRGCRIQTSNCLIDRLGCSLLMNEE